jgi:hypothetical protein
LFSVALLLIPQPLLADIDTTGSGTIAETIDVNQYIYLRLMENGNWLAAAPSDIKVGDKINYSGGALMKDFYSRALDRTFEEILFVMSVYVTEKAPEIADDRAMIEHVHKAAENGAPEPPKPGELAPLEGGMTIADVYSGYRNLQDQVVSVRARVMKVSPKVKGKNWVTLQDGTGNSPENKLIATTNQVVNIGDEVIVEGTVATDISLGSGYDYKVLIESASFTN